MINDPQVFFSFEENMFAIIEHNKNQYKVMEGATVVLPNFEIEEKKELIFDKVLLVSDEKTLVGKPYLADYTVSAEIIGTERTKKVSVIKFHAKKRYKRIGSQRQDMVLVKINKIVKK